MFKKRQLLFFFTIFLFLNPNLIEASYGVELYNIINYNMTKSSIFISAFNETYSKDGFSIYTYPITTGGSFYTNVTYLASHQINYKVCFEEVAIEHFQFSYKDYIELKTMIGYTFNMPPILVLYWDNFTEELFTHGLNVIYSLFYVENIEDSWRTFRNFKEDYLAEMNSFWGDLAIITCTDKIEENNNEIISEWYLNGIYNFQSGPSIYNNFTSSTFFKCAYSKTIGNVLGGWIKGTSTGIIHNESVDFSFEQKFEMEGYSLDEFELGNETSNAVNFSWITPISFFTIILVSKIFDKKINGINKK